MRGLIVVVLLLPWVAGVAAGASERDRCVDDVDLEVEGPGDRVTLRWRPPHDGVPQRVFRSVNGGPLTEHATLPSTSGTFVDERVPQGDVRYAVVVDPDANGCAVSGARWDRGCVEALRAVARLDGSVRVAWPPSDEALQYSVYREGDDGRLVLDALLPPNAASYTDPSGGGGLQRYAVISDDGNVEPEATCLGTLAEIMTAAPLAAAAVGTVAALGMGGVGLWRWR